jgi:Raf kinase inhibitor-like YbhB/YbcL family protein
MKADRSVRLTIVLLLVVLLIPLCGNAQDFDRGQFQVTSTTFRKNATLPLSTLSNIAGSNGLNTCSIDGSPGGNQSPELMWTRGTPATRSFAVVAYDITAAFTHWEIYNISPRVTELPGNAGIVGSPYGTEIVNDYFVAAEYDGPCPPANVSPFVHHYAFTVYALTYSSDCHRLRTSPQLVKRYTKR